MGKLMAFAVVALGLGLTAAAGNTVRAAWFREDISCEIGEKIAGYGPNDVSVGKLDDLEACGLCIDDGERKLLIVALDLLGMDADILDRVRHACAGELGVPDDFVMLTCTHTHGGPRTSSPAIGNSRGDVLNADYVRRFESRLLAAVRKLAKGDAWRECRVGYFSVQCDQNLNRRFTTADNCASFIAHRRMLQRIADGIADKELGTIALFDPKTWVPVYVIGNYAAHPLAAHGPGFGGLRITSDFPGFFRRYISRETHAEAMFINGAAGDLVPKGDELGEAAARKVGEELAMSALASVIDIQRNSKRFVMENPRVGASFRTFSAPLRARCRGELGKDALDVKLQCVSIGDVAFVGVPGETVNELGLEIKWHSPFRRTFIAYCSTGYFGYISPANFKAAGGYEPQSQYFTSKGVWDMLGCVRDGLFGLRNSMFPDENAGEDGYPDNLELPLVNLPGGFKASKWLSRDSDFAGHWALDMPSGWIDIDCKAGDCTLKFLWEGGSPTPMKGKVSDGVLVAEGPAQPWEGKDSRRYLTLRLADRGISGDMRIVEGDGRVRTSGTFTGSLAPEMPPRPDLSKVRFGTPVDLLAEGLGGWETLKADAEFGWTFKDGVLSNRVRKDEKGRKLAWFANIRTKRTDFTDFKIEFDVRVPAGCNSGVYLRGLYELQVFDSYGQPVDCHNMAAIYGRITPRIAAERPAGEWQHVSAILCDRHVTVELNGKRIIDNEPVEGVTGRSLTTDVMAPGPIYLQGDHTDADYRNMILTPIE